MRLLNPLFALLGAATDPQLARMVEHLKSENRILRDKLARRVTVTLQERNRLVKLGQGLGSVLKDILTIVSTRTFARWMAAEKGSRQRAALGRRSRPTHRFLRYQPAKLNTAADPPLGCGRRHGGLVEAAGGKELGF